MTKQIFPFFCFCFIRELNPHPPSTHLSAHTVHTTHRARTQTLYSALTFSLHPSHPHNPSVKSILKFVYFEQKGGFNELNLRILLIKMICFGFSFMGFFHCGFCRLLGGVVVVCVFITAGPITKLFAGGGGGEWTTCAMIDDEPRPVWMSPLVTH